MGNDVSMSYRMAVKGNKKYAHKYLEKLQTVATVHMDRDTATVYY